MAKAKESVVKDIEAPTQSKAERLAKLTKDINAKWVKKGVISADRPLVGSLGTMAALRGKKIPSGNLTFDLKFKGGYTRGTSTLAWGPAGVGKSMAAMMTAAQCIKEGGTVLWIQTDPGDPLEMARIQGIPTPEDNPHFLHFNVVGSGEMTFEILQNYLTDENKPTDLIDLVVVDSIAGLAPREELEAIKKDGLAASSQGMSLPERMMSRLFRIMHSTKMYDRAAVILISEARVDLGSYNSPLKAKGGNATKHGVRLDLRYSPIGGQDGLLKIKHNGKDIVLGHRYRIKVIKDGICHRWQHSEWENDIYYGKSLDNDIALFGLLMEEDGLIRSGATYTAAEVLKPHLPNPDWKIVSEARVKEALKTDVPFKNGCLAFLKDVYNSVPGDYEEDETEAYIENQLEELEVVLQDSVEISEEIEWDSTN